MAILIRLVSGAPGPLIGALAMIVGHVSLGASSVISSLTYAVVYPLAIIAATLYYLRISDRLPAALADPLAAPSLAPASANPAPALSGARHA